MEKSNMKKIKFKRVGAMTLLLLAGFRADIATAQLPPPAQSNSLSDAQSRTNARPAAKSRGNNDESKANPYPLPDPLDLKNGQPVKDADTWWNQRRPEILEDFRAEMYGRFPENTPKVTWEVTSTETNSAGGLAIKKSIVGHIDNSRYPAANPSIHLTLYTPSNAKGPVPVIVVVVAGPGGYGAPRAGAPATQPEPPPGSPLYQLLAIGWGYATMEVGPIQNDYSGGLTSGIIGLMSAGQPRKPDDWGALAAWSWGLSRAMDYFETDKSVDAKQMGVEGHSRYGKTALLAAALDPRWAIVFPSCSGEGGAKPSRRNFGETVDNVATSHWFAPNFHKYAGHWNDLPVDSDELIALVAPRPIFLNGGTGDPWADPHGAFLAAVAAGPVYRLLGKKDLGSTEMPAPDTALTSGDIAFRYHNGPHSDVPDWPAFIQFAQRYLKVPGLADAH
jgi:(4-O-methyl)-D-glucuronate---lignin esterase